MVDSDIPGRADERLCQAARLEALPRRAGIGRVLPDDLRAKRDQPLERLVEAVEDGALQLLVAAGTFSAEVLEGAVAPDDAAREQHRSARARALLDYGRPRPELTGARCRAEAGHPGAGYEH